MHDLQQQNVHRQEQQTHADRMVEGHTGSIYTFKALTDGSAQVLTWDTRWYQK
jgi:hypothetical protein